MKKSLLFVLIINIAFGLCGCTQGSDMKKNTETEKMEATEVVDEMKLEETMKVNTMQEGTVMLMKLLNCDEKQVGDIEMEFEDVTGAKIEDAELIPTEKKISLVKVQAQGKEYYLKINSVGMLIEIRADKTDGTVLFQVNY